MLFRSAGHPYGAIGLVSEAMIHGPSLVVHGLADRSTVRPGDTFHAILYLNNTGDETASRVWLNATLPSWTALEDSQPIAGVVSGGLVRYALQDVVPARLSISLRFRVLSDAPAAANLSMAAILELQNATRVSLRPSSTTTTSIVVTPQFVLRLAASTRSVSPGDTIDFVIGWNNTGNEAASRVWLNFTLPAKTLLVSASAPWSVTNGTSYGWVFDGVAPGLREVGVRVEASARLADRKSVV